jgi:hypothetical protein
MRCPSCRAPFTAADGRVYCSGLCDPAAVDVIIDEIVVTLPQIVLVAVSFLGLLVLVSLTCRDWQVPADQEAAMVDSPAQTAQWAAWEGERMAR